MKIEAQDSARDRQQMRHEHQRDFASERGADLLLDLGHVAMVADLVGAEVFVDLGEQLIDRRSAARAGGARFGVDDDRRRLDQIAPDERQQREQRAGREASGDWPPGAPREALPMEFAQAVHRLLEQLRRGMLDAVGGAVLRRDP